MLQGVTQAKGTGGGKGRTGLQALIKSKQTLHNCPQPVSKSHNRIFKAVVVCGGLCSGKNAELVNGVCL